MKRILALALVLALCLSSAAFASTTVKSKTSLKNAKESNLNNIELVIRELDGYVIPAGGTFSFNEVVGPRTKEYGYVEAPNARNSYVYGGGAAQVASTLYLALLELQSNFYINEIDTYGSSEFKNKYVSDRNYAVVTSYDKDDFVFTNEFNDSIEINMWIDDDNLRCSLTLANTDNASLDGKFSDWDADRMPSGITLLGKSRIWLDSKTTSNAMTQNIKRAASAIHGVVVGSGEEFSFNDIVGARTQKTGYINAKNGRGAFTVGGGVAQVASALWLAIEDAEGIYVTEMYTYGEDYNQSYVEDARDAIVTDYNADKDFCFRNESGAPVTIAMFVEDDNIWCRVYHAVPQISFW